MIRNIIVRVSSNVQITTERELGLPVTRVALVRGERSIYIQIYKHQKYITRSVHLSNTSMTHQMWAISQSARANFKHDLWLDKMSYVKESGRAFFVEREDGFEICPIRGRIWNSRAQVGWWRKSKNSSLVHLMCHRGITQMDTSSYVLLTNIQMPLNDRFDFKREKGVFLAFHDSLRSQIPDVQPTTFLK